MKLIIDGDPGEIIRLLALMQNEGRRPDMHDLADLAQDVPQAAVADPEAGEWGKRVSAALTRAGIPFSGMLSDRKSARFIEDPAETAYVAWRHPDEDGVLVREWWPDMKITDRAREIERKLVDEGLWRDVCCAYPPHSGGYAQPGVATPPSWSKSWCMAALDRAGIRWTRLDAMPDRMVFTEMNTGFWYMATRSPRSLLNCRGSFKPPEDGGRETEDSRAMMAKLESAGLWGDPAEVRAGPVDPDRFLKVLRAAETARRYLASLPGVKEGLLPEGCRAVLGSLAEALGPAPPTEEFRSASPGPYDCDRCGIDHVTSECPNRAGEVQESP